MRSYDELEDLWRQTAVAPRGAGEVRLIVVRAGGGSHATPAEVVVTVAEGVSGDRWVTGTIRRQSCQVTLMSVAVAELVTAGATPLHEPGDNFLVDLDLSETGLPAGSRIRLGSALLEVTDTPHLGCRKFQARFGAEALRWVNAREHRARRLRGVNCRVVEGGVVRIGDPALLLDQSV